MQRHDDWFVTRQVADRVWLVAEPPHVNSWLVAGSERAVMLDTGMGIRPIRPLAEALCGRPVGAVTTHYHFDHTGGHHEFDHVIVHAAGAVKLKAGPSRRILEAYVDSAERMRPQVEAWLRIDDELQVLAADMRPRVFPSDFNPGMWDTRPVNITETVTEGDAIDLGDRTLTVLHTPGHSPDSISLLDERAGLVFVADAFNLGQIYCHFDDSSCAELATTAARLAELADQVRGVCVHHHPRVIAEPALLRAYAEATERVAAGDGVYRAGVDCFGYPIRVAEFENFAITVPVPGAPPLSLHQPLGQASPRTG
jgi:glyoxylase-like metal-dependent hydrolase (beta-lactamase superfamily II)